MNRIIPATMATQHPDNACVPYWEQDGDGFVSTHEEVAECYAAFHDLGCQEFMWDWEGKYVDEAVVDKLFHTYHDYFKKHQLGRDKFLTFRIPNIWHEKGYGLARALMGILTAESFASDLKLHTPPLFEVILPMTDKAEHIMYIQDTFTKLAKFKCKLFEQTCSFEYLNVLPLIEGVDDLLHTRPLLDTYLALHKKRYKRKPAYLRLHIARSDPALNAGLVPAMVAGKAALSEYHRFGRDTGIAVYPAVGVGTLPFRGGLSPERIDDFLIEYSGVRTVYIQSAFRYDFALPLVKTAIATLNNKLQKTPVVVYTKPELVEMNIICDIFSRPYRVTVERLAETINTLSGQVPQRRERKLHVGLFGYSRGIGTKRLPRAIPFTAVLYSLGVPPELIGTGRGLQALAKTGIDAEKYYLNLKKDITWAGRFVNKENIAILAKRSTVWRDIQNDVMLIEKYLGVELGPQTHDDIIHRNIVSTALHRWRSGQPITTEIMESGKLRRSLG